jgi:hypothetical protein
MLWCCTVLYVIVRCDFVCMVCCSVVWCGVVYCRVEWCCIVLKGIVCVVRCEEVLNGIVLYRAM